MSAPIPRQVTVLVDVGSTFTKMVAVARGGLLLAREQAPSTVATDVTVGFHQALEMVRAKLPSRAKVERLVASSSAAGGLAIVAVGLVPELTMEAARRAALSAGGKVVGAFGYQITRDDTARMELLRPDLILLAGGTDGGDYECLMHNAKQLAEIRRRMPVIVAGNRTVAAEAAEILKDSGKPVRVVGNVMPELGRLDVAPARTAIQEIFIENIVHAKGLDGLLEFTDGVVMPTPLAVVKAAELISGAFPGSTKGTSDLLLVDVGGATTDVVSIGAGVPSTSGVVQRGLPEPLIKRTVEGDLGIRHNASTIVETAGEDTVARLAAIAPASLSEHLRRLEEQPARIAETGEEARLDAALSQLATRLATTRHAGWLETAYGPGGRRYLVQNGKDLSRTGLLVGTGGSIAFSKAAREILGGALAESDAPFTLKPEAPRILFDARYVLFAVGLLSESDPESATELAKLSLVEIDRGGAGAFEPSSLGPTSSDS